MYISASAATDIYYLLNKYLRDKNKVNSVFGKLLEIIIIADVNDFIVRRAFSNKWNDFEDSVQYVAAEILGADYIITRNAQDFESDSIPVLSPDDFLQSVI